MLSTSICATAEAYHLVIWVHSWYDGFVPAMRHRKERIYVAKQSIWKKVCRRNGLHPKKRESYKRKSLCLLRSTLHRRDRSRHRQADSKKYQRKNTGEVTRRLKEITTSIDTGTYLPSCKLTVGEWLNTWISEYTADWKPLTVSNYSKQIKKHLIPRLGAAKLEDLDTHTIQLFYNSLTKSGLAPKTVKNIHGVLHAALEQAISNGYIHKNPTAGCKLPKVVRPEIKPLEPEEIARMLKEAKKDAYDNLFIVAMFTGMRQGELLGLSWDNVNFKTGQITIKQQLQCKDGVYFLETPKSGKCRVLSPAPVVMEALKDEQQQQNANKQIVGAAWENKWNLAFTDALGKNLVRRTVVKHFKAVIERANIPSDVRFHDLRHSFAVTSLYSGDDVKTVQANLGHATAQFTLDVYGHVTQKMRQESAMRMQAFYNHLEV